VDHPTLGRPLVVANPRAGRGAGRGTGRAATDVVRRLLAALEQQGILPDVVETTHAGHATVLAREAAEAGRRFVIAVGGDGTVHEVVNGLIDPSTGVPRGPGSVAGSAQGAAAPRGTVLGVVSAGSGCDLVRTFGLDRSPEVLARHLASTHTTSIDLGRVRCTGTDGEPLTRLFANVAEVGFGGAVATAARRLPAALGPQRYRIGIVTAWGRFRRVDMRVTHDGGTYEAPLCNVVVANGQFFGGGLKVAPRSLPDDGRFDVQAWGGTPTDVVRAARQLRDGSHLARADVRTWPSAQVTVTAGRDVAVEADGELIGTAPATFDVLHRALTFKV
jgi:diacylglycerol kinase (ATP)